MFKVLKYLLLANLYSRAKKSFISLLICIVSLVLVTFIMSDIISVASGMTLHLLIIIKWLLVIGLMGFISYHILKIINIATTPFSKDTKAQAANTSKVDSKKERILNKEKLFTKSDSILEKYIKVQ
jgi:hypothetical protein